MLKEREQEIEKMARKMVLMDVSSLHIMNVLAEGLMAKENLDKKRTDVQEMQKV